MSRIACFLVLLAAAAHAQEESPAQKVVYILQNIKAETQAQQQQEAALQAEHAAYCEENKAQRATAVTTDNDQIALNQASVDSFQSQMDLKVSERSTRQGQVLSTQNQMQDQQSQCDKERSEYEANAADVAKAMTSLNKAITILEASRATGSAASFAQVRSSLQDTLAFADAMGHNTQKLQAFLQVDPANPEYQSQVQSPIELLQTMLSEFTEQKNEMDEQYAKSKQACADLMASLEATVSSDNEAIVALGQEINELQAGSGTANRNLGISQDALGTDSSMLEDLTKECESKAAEWAKRSTQLAQELAAIDGTISALSGSSSSFAQMLSKGVSLLQSEVVRAPISLRGRTPSKASQDKAVAILNKEGSPKLAALATQISANPFNKIKSMINELINRLQDEALEETTKKAYCDKEMGKATTERDHKITKIKKINAEIASLLAQNTTLPAEIQELSSSVTNSIQQLSFATAQRANETAAATAAINENEEALVAVSNATEILGGYLNVAKGKASPGLQNVLAMLQELEKSFKSTIAEVRSAEKKAQESFVVSERTARADIAGKQREMQAYEQDLVSVKDELSANLNTNGDLASASALVDDAVKTIEELKPMCSTTGMSYAERVAAREQEKQALQNAICALDEEHVEPDCVSTA